MRESDDHIDWLLQDGRTKIARRVYHDFDEGSGDSEKAEKIERFKQKVRGKVDDAAEQLLAAASPATRLMVFLVVRPDTNFATTGAIRGFNTFLERIQLEKRPQDVEITTRMAPGVLLD